MPSNMSSPRGAQQDTSLLDQAEQEYSLLSCLSPYKQQLERNRQAAVTVRPLPHFDFATAEELQPLPVHEIELRIEERRRRGYVDVDTSRNDFVASLGITIEDTCDPVTGHTVLEVKQGVREYYGDPEDEAYRAFRYSIARTAEDEAWLKTGQFVGSTVALETDRLHQWQARVQAALGGGGGQFSLNRSSGIHQSTSAVDNSIRDGDCGSSVLTASGLSAISIRTESACKAKMMANYRAHNTSQ